MKKNRILLLLIIYLKNIICNDNFIELKKYPIKYDYDNLNFNTKFTADIVNNKIYIFGGFYEIPNSFDDNILGFEGNKYNVTNEVYSYNIEKDEWKFETFTPFPLLSGITQAIDENIYLFDIKWNITNSKGNSDMWIYNTNTKEWIQKEYLPFNWNGKLITCEKNNKIYFIGSENDYQKNIIHIYDTTLNIWENPIIISQRFDLYCMICKKDKLHFLGKETNYDFYSYNNEIGIITINSDNMTYKFTNLKMDFYDISISNIDNYIYLFNNVYRNVNNNNAFMNSRIYEDQINITRINLDMHTKNNLGPLLFPIKNPLAIPYNGDIYLFGGKLENEKNRFKIKKYKDIEKKEKKIKTFHHKFIIPKMKNEKLNFKIQY